MQAFISWVRPGLPALIFMLVASTSYSQSSYPLKASLGGAQIAEGEMTLFTDADAYRLEVSVTDAGLASLFFDISFEGSVEGQRTAPHRLSPDLLRIRNRDDDKVTHLEIAYENGNPLYARYEPEPDWLEDPLPLITEQAGTIDTLTVFAHFLLPGRPEHMCGTQMEVFTGARRVSLTIAEPELPVSELVVCPMEYRRKRIGRSGATEEQIFDFSVELARLEDGHYVAHRILGQTRFGMLVIARQE